MATAIEQKIEALEAKLKQAKAHKRALEARQKATVTKAERALDTRKKILLGAMLANEMERSQEAKNNILGRLNGFLKSDKDREIFGLPKINQHDAT